MEEKKVYRIVDNDFPDDVIFVMLTKSQVNAIEKFIEWANYSYNYTITEMSDIIPVEW